MSKHIFGASTEAASLLTVAKLDRFTRSRVGKVLYVSLTAILLLCTVSCLILNLQLCWKFINVSLAYELNS